MADNPPTGVPQIYPRLAYRNPTEAVAWLSRAFGLRERERARVSTEDGKISLTEMEFGAGLVMIGTDGAHDLASPATLGGMSQMVMVYVDHVDEHHARAKEAGAQVVMALEDQPWGDRRSDFRDQRQRERDRGRPLKPGRGGQRRRGGGRPSCASCGSRGSNVAASAPRRRSASSSPRARARERFPVSCGTGSTMPCALPPARPGMSWSRAFA